ncbi:hypothetical protein WJ47_17380 [Burkholderia ubonensis]|uniref:Uncharacterized protein n=1 Tax=Burkholderia ubonensis TaxID=101571 RepID=A0AB73FZA6_9BURK|nr:hypothetical protein WJ44_15480 [Burkholderia ubonensis]KVL61871.1 hypothetical protein WJ47_17380 [Burkholderia ubonensis]KVM28650.1 hypothetical protein WJ53_09370 [Burkholderia ubonensis]KVM35160.1 hypothetical protein WJ54_36365 [Burkholderia ubonensis]
MEQALGVAGKLALVVIVAALVIRQWFIVPTSQLIRQRHEEAVGTIEMLERTRLNHDDTNTEPAPWELPRAKNFTPRVIEIVTLLKDAGFVVQDAAFSQARVNKMSLEQLNMEVPLVGDYPGIRQAVARLDALPGCRVDRILAERKSIAENRVEIRLKLRLIGVTE